MQVVVEVGTSELKKSFPFHFFISKSPCLKCLRYQFNPIKYGRLRLDNYENGSHWTCCYGYDDGLRTPNDILFLNIPNILAVLGKSVESVMIKVFLVVVSVAIYLYSMVLHDLLRYSLCKKLRFSYLLQDFLLVIGIWFWDLLMI